MPRTSDPRVLIERLLSPILERASREVLSEQPKDPKGRAMFRMNDAAKRGGVAGLIKAVNGRVKATASPDKLQGMADALGDIIAELTRAKIAASTKAKRAA